MFLRGWHHLWATACRQGLFQIWVFKSKPKVFSDKNIDLQSFERLASKHSAIQGYP
jgi:hypothetical protein